MASIGIGITDISQYLVSAASSLSNITSKANKTYAVPKDDEPILTGLATSLPVLANTSEKLSFFLSDRLKTAQVQEDVHIEKIIVLDNAKEVYLDGLRKVDGLLLKEIDSVNNAIQAVNDAYQARISSGCKTDLFWRLTDYSVTVTGGGSAGKATIPPKTTSTYTYTCTRLNGGTPYPAVGIERYNAWVRSRRGFGGRFGAVSVPDENLSGDLRNSFAMGGTGATYTGLSTTTVQYVSGPNGEQSSVPLNSKFGLEEVNLYGIKLYDEPYTKDIGDTFITSFIGTCGIGTNVVIAMAPINSGGISNIQVGQLVVCSKPNIFTIDAYRIIGVGTATANLTGIVTASSSDAVSSTTVLKLTLDENTLDDVFAPEDNGNYVTFTILSNPDDFGNLAIGRSATPYVPQTIKCPMTTSDIGKGVRIEFDKSGAPQGTQSWNQFLEGEFNPDSLIVSTDENVGYGTTVISGIGTTAIIGTIEISRTKEYRSAEDMQQQIKNNKVREPVLGGGKIFHRLGFDYAPVIYTNADKSEYRLAKEGEKVVLNYPMGKTPPNITMWGGSFPSARSTTSAGVEKLPSCSASIEQSIKTTVAAAGTATAALTDGEINDWRTVANLLRSDLTDINLRIWSERQLLGDCKERQGTYSTRSNLVGTYSSIIDGTSTTRSTT